MNIFDQYGIKEVADVTIYSIHKKEDGSGEVYYVPALYLDTLKVTTTEKTAENTWAQGGLGNSRLISWDYGKTINLSLEDALCTPASLGLCWGGILSADWKDGSVQHQTGMVNLDCATERISRMEKAFYPRNDGTVVSDLLPRDKTEDILEGFSGEKVFLSRSSVLDGTNVKGFGYLDGKPYKWYLEIESAVKSIVVVPDRFFSIYGKSYPIKKRQTVGINQPSEAFKYEIIYLRGYDKYNDETPAAKIIYHKQMEQGEQTLTCTNADDNAALGYLNDADNYPYLKLRVCWDGSIRAYLGSVDVDWGLKRQIEDSHVEPDTKWVEIPQINTDQFRNIDLWVRFDSINALAYYLITKYENNIYNIAPKEITEGITTKKDDASTADVVGKDYNLQDPAWVGKAEEDDACTPCCKKDNMSRAIWAYINPKTMTPFDDDYWFHQGEPYYKKSLTLSTKQNPLKAQKIYVEQGVFPGMYKIVAETLIRERDTGEDERVQITLPLCKIKSDQTLTLQADGDPTTFNLDVEVATPQNGIPMEITFYEVEKETKTGCSGGEVALDGSTKISAK